MSPAVIGGLVLAAGLVVGMVTLIYYDKCHGQPARPSPAVDLDGDGRRWRDAVTDPHHRQQRHDAAEAGQLALMIATGIGLHNFAEGLAIGSSAASGGALPGGAAGDWVRAAQRHRGVRHRRPLAAAGIRPSGAQLVVAGVPRLAPEGRAGALIKLAPCLTCSQRFADVTRGRRADDRPVLRAAASASVLILDELGCPASSRACSGDPVVAHR